MFHLFRAAIKRSFLPVLAFALLFLLASCFSVPDGEAPEGPIVRIDESTSNSKTMGEESALNRMITSVATSCPPICSRPGSHAPAVSNEFYPTSFDYMQMDLWRSLIKMGLIRPVLPGSEEEQYRMISSIREEGVDGLFRWEIKIVSGKTATADNPVWSDSVLFSRSSKSP